MDGWTDSCAKMCEETPHPLLSLTQVNMDQGTAQLIAHHHTAVSVRLVATLSCSGRWVADGSSRQNRRVWEADKGSEDMIQVRV